MKTEKNEKNTQTVSKNDDWKTLSKLHTQVRVVIYEIITADQESSLTEKQQEITLLNIH